jgi:hypothetical protein
MLNNTADSSLVDFMTVTPSSPALDTAGTTSTISTQITVSGEYFSVQEYLHRLERLPRVAKVMQLLLSPSENEAGVATLTVSLTAEFYTTDLSAGPGSMPGHTGQAAIAPPLVAASPPPTGA